MENKKNVEQQIVDEICMNDEIEATKLEEQLTVDSDIALQKECENIEDELVDEHTIGIYDDILKLFEVNAKKAA